MSSLVFTYLDARGTRSPDHRRLPRGGPQLDRFATAVQKMGLKQFALTPVAVWPFKVVSDDPNAELVVKKNRCISRKASPT